MFSSLRASTSAFKLLVHFLTTHEVSYLVCVDVSGAVAPAAVVTSEITQKPPGQAREVPVVQSYIQFGPFAG